MHSSFFKSSTFCLFTNITLKTFIVSYVEKAALHVFKWTIGWAEKLAMSKIDYGHEVPIVIHKNEAISLFTF